MGETVSPIITGFNRSLRVESRIDRLTEDPGAVLLREVLERSGIVSWMTARLNDPRSKLDVTHDLAALIHAPHREGDQRNHHAHRRLRDDRHGPRRKMLVRPAKSGDLDVRRHATLGMSD